MLGSGLVTRSQLESVLQSGGGDALYDTLAARGILSQDELRRAAAHVAGVSFVSLSPHDIPLEVLSLIPEPVARTYNVVAYNQDGNTVEVALLDLADLDKVAFLREQHSYTILPRLTTSASIKQTLHAYQKLLKEKFKALLEGGAHAVHALIGHALLSRATGVHLDLRETGLLVRYRIQGLLHEAMLLPREAAQIFERLKEMADLSLTLNAPQEGGFKAELGGGESALVRVHSLPAHTGERIVLHLTPERSRRSGFTLESLGLHGRALDTVHALLQQRDGLIVVAGPLGSGTTTTLYTMLDIVSERGGAVATVEEEIEYALPHAAQTKVRRELGLDTAATLRAVLRQDPDIVMVGNLDDQKAAALALSAAARGVLVLAGVDAPCAADAIDKLRGWGASPLALAATVRGVVGVQVVRKLCNKEREEYKLARVESAPLEVGVGGRAGANFGRILAALKEEGVADKDAQWKELLFARASACPQCESGPDNSGAGYKGLVGLQEVLPVTAPVGEVLKEGAGAARVEEVAREDGMLTLAEDGLFKAAQGLTSVEEVLRVTAGPPLA